MWVKPLPDDEIIDEVRIRTVPRYKTSDLSGDEWRVAAEVVFLRKGQALFSRSFSTIDVAVRWVSYGIIETQENMDYDPNVFARLCAQPGCPEDATTLYRLKVEYENGRPQEHQSGEAHRGFCGRHAERGDGDKEDTDDNYELVAGEYPTVNTRNSDDAIGGIIDLEGDGDG